MNKKKIASNINFKINQWVKTLPEDLRETTLRNVIVTGGCITSMLLDEPVNDYDIYFKNPEVLKGVVDYYLNGYTNKNKTNKVKEIFSKIESEEVKIYIKSSGIITNNTGPEDEYQYFESTPDNDIELFIEKIFSKDDSNNKYLPIIFTSNAISLTGDIQIITRFTGQPDVIHGNFDFDHTRNYWTYYTGLVLNSDAVEATLLRELRYTGSQYPVCALFRTRKFIKRGWKINAGQMFKMIYDCSMLNLNDYTVLKEQLIGVDIAYFCEVLSILKNKDLNIPGARREIDKTYLFSLLDNVFDEDGQPE